MILPILANDQDILHQSAAPIGEITPEIKSLAADMRETMLNAKGVGLAAPQIGQPVALFVAEMPDEDPDYAIPFFALINPRITWKSKKMTSLEEGCLSIPGVEGPVQRADRIRVKAKNLDGETIEIEAEGYLARIMQHEIDHLNGVLFTELVPKKKLKTRPLVDYPRI